jgi:hypothetical protein
MASVGSCGGRGRRGARSCVGRAGGDGGEGGGREEELAAGVLETGGEAAVCAASSGPACGPAHLRAGVVAGVVSVADDERVAQRLEGAGNQPVDNRDAQKARSAGWQPALRWPCQVPAAHVRPGAGPGPPVRVHHQRRLLGCAQHRQREEPPGVGRQVVARQRRQRQDPAQLRGGGCGCGWGWGAGGGPLPAAAGGRPGGPAAQARRQRVQHLAR